ncbi:extracellular solute-binding protein [Mitsuaria sp. WAJ17]|uniref:ABC transporter substrate-binding protein n=1 Tax=Mitsuaria sp. WAJ17 TaxID=2761452 RepID=UPI001602F363|nr:extracellular solute-binding protein [Mitsuaria sp. WAJ17]MBB2484162.1 extracellular solute-binding protein [Mitsuaria sp. WAJ17]
MALRFLLVLSCVLGLPGLLGPHGPAAAQPGAKVLRVLAWPGYADPEVLQGFTQKTGARVELTVVGSDEAMRQRLLANKGGDFDVFALNTAELQQYIEQGMALPIDLQRIPNTRRQLPRFRELASIPGLSRRREGQLRVFAVPYTYSEMGLIYDRRQITTPPGSLQDLWDPRWKGKVLAYAGGTHNFSLAALALGQAQPFHIEDSRWPAAVDKLVALRRNVLSFYSLPEESVQLFQRHRVALMYANYGMQQVHLLKAAGADVGYVIPREGALAWLDCWAISTATRQPELAHAWINFMLEEPASSLLVTRQGLANTVSESVSSAPQVPLRWLEPVEDEPRRELLWSRIQSGDQPSKVLHR